jgi:uncharacterized protein YndB with AHSA1/START domain
MPAVTMDRIEKHVRLKAPRARVWRALTDSTQFGTWFGARFDGPFEAGKRVRGTIVGTAVDAEVAATQQPFVGKVFEIVVDRIEPERLFSFRWTPGAADDAAAAHDPMTLVEFTLEEAPEGILLRVTESGFGRIPLERRAKAFTDNEGGWAIQMTLIEKYLGQDASRQG